MLQFRKDFTSPLACSHISIYFVQIETRVFLQCYYCRGSGPLRGIAAIASRWERVVVRILHSENLTGQSFAVIQPIYLLEMKRLTSGLIYWLFRRHRRPDLLLSTGNSYTVNKFAYQEFYYRLQIRISALQLYDFFSPTYQDSCTPSTSYREMT